MKRQADGMRVRQREGGGRVGRRPGEVQEGGARDQACEKERAP